jgi:hypothetical protein
MSSLHCCSTSNQNINNIKNNNPQATALKCFPTSFGGPSICSSAPP